MPTKTEFLKRCTVTELSVVKDTPIVRGARMSDFEIMMYGFLIIATAGSYWIGRKQGITDTVDLLEATGVLEFDDTPKK